MQTVTQADLDAGQILNKATATGKQIHTATDITSNQATAKITLDTHPALTIVKTSNITSTTVNGDIVTYWFTVKNTGDVTLHNVAIADELAGIGPTNPLTVASLGVGAQTVFTANYTVTQADIDAGKITNKATATALDPQNGPVTSEKAILTDLPDPIAGDHAHQDL